jgi:hypothetical protein
MMRHFSLEEWADFTNRNIGPDKRAFMEHHLESNCFHCTNIISNWQSLKHFALQESQFEVPRGAVALAKVAFAAHWKKPRPGALTILAQLVFDSFRQPELAGVRSGAVDSRCLLYRAGPVLIDLSLDLTQNSGHIALQGQVMGSETEAEARGMEEIPVSLQSGRETIARTQTNKFGKFQLGCSVRKSLQVSVALNPQENVLIVLDESAWVPRLYSSYPQ